MTTPERPSIHMRMTLLMVVVGCLFLALFARLWFLQVINAPSAQAVAAQNGVQVIYTQAPRGQILDDEGHVLVGNKNVPVIEVDRQVAVQNPQMIAYLAPLLGMTTAQLNTAINNLEYSPYTPVPVQPDATAQQILYIKEHQSLFPGVTASTIAERSYSPLGMAAGNILGYVGQINSQQLKELKSKGYQAGDQIGLAGIEASYEQYLRGTPGIERVQVNSAGQVLATLSTTPPVPGNNLRLTINGYVQQTAEKAIQQGMTAAKNTYDKVTHENFKAPAGSAVVENPTNGRILALATYPTYDPQEFVGGISQKDYKALLNNPSDPLLDRTIQGQYAPGSTFKLVTAIAGLKYGIITPDSIFNDTGSIKIGTFVAHNDNGEAYGPINLTQALTVSSDNYFNTIGLKLWYDYTGHRKTSNGKKVGPTALQQVANAFGFGNPTGINLPNEYPGKIPTPASYMSDYKSDPAAFGGNTGQKGVWYPGNSDGVAIGQDEDLVTPLQLANAYASFANGGTVYVPQLVKDAETARGKVVKTFGPQITNKIKIKSGWRSAMIQGYDGVTHASDGTAYGVFGTGPLSAPQYDIAGKTGTAQVNPPRQDTSVFTSFSPATHPKYVVDAMMEDAGYGASVAAPVVREIYDQLYKLPLQPVTYKAANGTGGQN